MLKEKIKSDLTAAIKDQQQTTISTLRNIISKITEEEKKKGTEINDDSVLSIIEKLAKQRRESADAFRSAGRLDLLEVELVEELILKEYLPTKFSDEELTIILKNLIDAGHITVGAIMKELGQYGAKVDRKLASVLLKTLFENN